MIPLQLSREQLRTTRTWVGGVIAAVVIAKACDRFTSLTIDMPMQTVVLGVIVGMTYGLLSVGLVLIFRTNKIINFALARSVPSARPSSVCVRSSGTSRTGWVSRSHSPSAPQRPRPPRSPSSVACAMRRR